jgi:endonuclease YncB( thermonuclease family)
MRINLGSLALAAALWLGAADARAASAPEPRYGPCRAERVIDGNTADLRCGTEVLRVRLVHVASPQPGETGHDEAGRALRALLHARELWLGFEPSGRPTLDGEGRLLVYLYDRAGQNLNVALVSLGWASYAATDGDDPLAANFQVAERDARAGQRAMWSVWAYTAGRGGPSDASER